MIKRSLSLKRLLRLNPDSHEPYYNLGMSYFESRQFDYGADSFEKCIRLKNNLPEAYFFLALCRQRLGGTDFFEKSEKNYLRAIELKENYSAAYYNLAILLETKQNHSVESSKKIEDLYLQALKHQPDFAQASFNLGAHYYELREFEKARERFFETLNRVPGLLLQGSKALA